MVVALLMQLVMLHRGNYHKVLQFCLTTTNLSLSFKFASDEKSNSVFNSISVIESISSKSLSKFKSAASIIFYSTFVICPKTFFCYDIKKRITSCSLLAVRLIIPFLFLSQCFYSVSFSSSNNFINAEGSHTLTEDFA